GTMRAPTRFHPDNARRLQGPTAAQKLGILLGVDVVRHDRQAIRVTQRLAETVNQRCLARTHRATHADSAGLGSQALPAQRWRLVLVRQAVMDIMHSVRSPYDRHSRE